MKILLSVVVLASLTACGKKEPAKEPEVNNAVTKYVDELQTDVKKADDAMLKAADQNKQLEEAYEQSNK